MEASYKMSFPVSRSCLWDNSATDEQIDLHLTSSHWLVVYVKKAAISLAVKHHCSKVKKTPSIYSTSCLLLGQAYSNETDDGLVLEVDRFDPGKVSSQDNQMLLPTATLPGDYVISLMVVTSATPRMEGMLTHNMMDMKKSFKELSRQCETVTALNPAGMASIRMLCSCDPDGPTHIAVKCGCVLVDHLISGTPIHTLPIVPTALARNLMGPHPLSAVQSRVRNGFLTMEQTRKLVLLLNSDPKVLTLPLVGVWLSGVSTPRHPVVWTACVQYAAPQSPLRDRVFSEDGHFLVLLFPPSPTHPICLQAKVGQGGCYDFHNCSCQLTRDELQAPGHVAMELIPAPPTSADHTLFMSSLKESCAGDHVISRRDNTRVRGDQHTMVACALDENASPDPHPTPTMAPRPPRSSDGSLCISVLDSEGRGSSYHVPSSVGGAPLADTNARILNHSMEKSYSCSQQSDSICSSSVTSHTNINRTDLKSLQEKVEMLLQSNSPDNDNSVINCEDHVSTSDTSSTVSPDTSFESHVTPQPHPSISSMVCSDSSGCGCSNTLDIQSYEDSMIQHSGIARLEEHRKGEGLKTAAKLPHFSQLSTPFVGESASIVVTSNNLNSTNETTVTESNCQYEVYQRMLHQVQQLLAAQDDTGTRSHDPTGTRSHDPSDITNSRIVDTSVQSSQYSEYCHHPQMMLRIPDNLDCLSTYGHTMHDDNDTTILPFPRIHCSSSYYHGNDSNVTMDEQAELISLKYLRKHQLISEGITLPTLTTKDTEVSMATQQYLQRHGLDNSSVLEQMKPYNSSDADNMVLDIKRLRSLPKLY